MNIDAISVVLSAKENKEVGEGAYVEGRGVFFLQTSGKAFQSRALREGREEPRGGLREGTAGNQRSMFQAGQGDSQCGGEDRGRGGVGRDEAVGQPEPGCMGPCRPQEGPWLPLCV